MLINHAEGEGKEGSSSLKIKICEFNLENLFISMEYYNGQNLDLLTEKEWRDLALAQLKRKQKPLTKVWGKSKAILDIDPDILMLIEVGGKDSLENFNKHFLQDRYVSYFIESNSPRSIDLGFLVRKSFPLRVEALSNREIPIEVHSYQGKYISRFSRDVAELRIFDHNEMKLTILLTHLKSKISKDRDFLGKDIRTAEANALVGIYEKLKSSFSTVPIILGGDFNAPLASLELELLNRTDLIDFNEILGTPMEQRYTFTHFDYAKSPHPQVLDYLLVSPHLRNRIVADQSYTYRYKNFYNIADELPKTMQERFQMPSDHYPLVLTIQLDSPTHQA
jgi:predicted extracellular nuclease